MAILAIIILMPSCGQYEDGPFFSLASKKSRVSNVWVIDRAYVNNNDATTLFTGLYPNYSLDLKMDDSYTTIWNSLLTENGTWRFDSSNESIITTPDNSTVSTTWRILRLKSDEFWVETTTGNDIWEYH